jgi:hypothetical protein
MLTKLERKCIGPAGCTWPVSPMISAMQAHQGQKHQILALKTERKRIKESAEFFSLLHDSH